MQKNTNVLNPEEMNSLKGGRKLVFTKNTLPKLTSQSSNTTTMSNMTQTAFHFDFHTLSFIPVVKCP